MSGEATTTAGPCNAFKVGIAFVKQYYKTLSSRPELLENFYVTTTAYLSHGEGSEPTEPLFSPKGIDHKEGIWGCAPGETMLFEFEDGAIDAQPSAKDGILLVVTASCIFKVENSGVERRTQFVQTFFLAKMGRNFAVQNDILRFLAPPSVAAVSEESIAEGSTAAVEEKTIEVGGKYKDALATEGSVSAESESSAPGAGVEETKEEVHEEEEATPVAAKEKKRSNSKEGKGKKNKGNKQQQDQTEAQQATKPAASKPTPGSWASLVVLGGIAPNNPRRAADNNTDVENDDGTTTTTLQDQAAIAETTKSATAKKRGKETKSTDQSNSQQQRNKRDPDNTLVIKNLGDNVKEQDILAMFQAFATATKGKIVGTNINHHRSLAFVDYDSVGPVLAALKKHNEKPLEMNGKVLEIDQKTLEQRARRMAAVGANSNNQNGCRPKNHNYSNNTGGTTGGRGGGEKFNKSDRRRGTRAGR